MSSELSKQYVPSEVEPLINQRWSEAQAFHADPERGGDPYCIVIPPPNVTAALHMGHALNNTLQDMLVRYHRMLGDNTLWMPGTDHAGIATQTVVEKRVLAEEGKRRTDFSREAFVAKIQAWKDEYEQRITEQLKAMGCSCDWQRQRFTMDPVCAAAVREAFFRLFKDGLIYRGKRLVNWDPVTQTALADDEVEMEEIDGHFYYLRYPLVDGSGHVTVATTRPETMLGDTAVAINPQDPRAAGLRSRKVRLPIVNREIPIIEDDYVVLPAPGSGDAKAEYATGFLKVTPAHDPNDWDIGQRHNLPVINVLAPDGTISKDHGWPAEEWPPADTNNEADFLLGMDRFEAREAIVEWFRTENLLEDVKPYRHSVGHSYRSHVPIEPYLSDQWYVRVTDERMRGAALRAMAQRDDSANSRGATRSEPASWENKLRFVPERYAKTFQLWHENIRDWCISRQLWWGHRIPVWSRDAEIAFDVEPTPVEGHDTDARLIATLDRSFGGDFDQTLARFPVHYCLTANPHPTNEKQIRFHLCLDRDEPALLRQLQANYWEQDPDVLDTWFSSALWPVSTLGWPGDTPELRTWNPSNTLCTAREIITLWVSRMVMFNLYFRGCLPFEDVFIHAMIQDGEGRKMSKSLGNGVDPLDIIHSHGADAMRFTLAEMTTDTQDVRLPVVSDPRSGRNTSPKFDIGRNFATKLWNAVRFALGNLEESPALSGSAAGGPPDDSALTLSDRWILSRLARITRDAEQALRNYEFSNCARSLREFFWNDLCDWHIEAIKPTVRDHRGQQRVLAACLDVVLRLLHPIMPFITEKLWERLNEVRPQRSMQGVNVPPSELLIVAAWPQVDPALIDAEAERDFELVRLVVSGLRQMRTHHKVAPKQRLDFSGTAPAAAAQRLAPQRQLVEVLANVTWRDLGPQTPRPTDAAAMTAGDLELYLHGLVDADAERARLGKRLEDLTRSIQTLEGRLANKSYTEKAPPHLVQQTREQLDSARREAQSVREELEAVGR